MANSQRREATATLTTPSSGSQKYVQFENYKNMRGLFR